MSDWWLGQLARQDQYGDTPPANWPEVYGGLTPDERGLQPQTATIGPAEMRSYTPTLGERLKGGLSDLFRSGGADTYNAGKLGDIAATGLSLLPPVGYSVAKSEMEHGVEGRNPTGIALGALGAIPGAKGVMGELASPFYSAAGRAVENAKLGKGTADQWLGYLRNQPGVKPEELQYVFGNLPEGQLTKAQMQAHAVANEVKLGEVTKGSGNSARYKELDQRIARGEQLTPAEMAELGALDANPTGTTKYEQWQLPGGENYRETLLTLPERRVQRLDQIEARMDEINNLPAREKVSPELNAEWDRLVDERQTFLKDKTQPFRSSHWDEPNVLAHVRTNDREIPGVGKSLHVEEIQSDWHQKGRSGGYRADEATLNPLKEKADAALAAARADPSNVSLLEARNEAQQALYNAIGNVPDAPFKSTWADVALKRQIREASEKGYDAISWTPGEAQAARYDLSKHVDKVNLIPHETIHQGGKVNYRVEAYKDNQKVIEHFAADEKGVADAVGKEVAEKLFSNRNQHGAATASGLDLKVGGEGMKAFYDKMLVDKANAIGKKHGARVEQNEIWPEGNLDNWPVDVLTKDGAMPVHVLRITPELRAAAMKGFPLFTAGGVVAGGTISELARQDKYGRNE